MLSAGAGGPIDVHLDVFLAEIDLDGVVDIGIDEDRGERGVPARLGVVGRDAHQPVHALLGLEEAVGVLALDLDGDRLDAGLFAGQQVEDGHLEAVPLGPADVHPHQHLGPVLRLGAAGAGVDGEEGVPRVVRTLQHRLELEATDSGSRLEQLGHLAGAASR